MSVLPNELEPSDSDREPGRSTNLSSRGDTITGVSLPLSPLVLTLFALPPELGRGAASVLPEKFRWGELGGNRELCDPDVDGRGTRASASKASLANCVCMPVGGPVGTNPGGKYDDKLDGSMSASRLALDLDVCTTAGVGPPCAASAGLE